MQTTLTKTASKEKTNSATLSKKSGKGRSHGVSSELTAFFHIRPGQTEELVAAIRRFQEKAQPKDTSVFEKVGLRTQRHVIFDNGTRVMWCTAFDTDWDPYIDDAIEIFGTASWVDWMQHTVEYPAGGMEHVSNAQIKQLLQSAQDQAITFFDAFSNFTLSEIKKALFVNQAFERILDNPEAAEAFQHPALQPMRELAAG